MLGFLSARLLAPFLLLAIGSDAVWSAAEAPAPRPSVARSAGVALADHPDAPRMLALARQRGKLPVIVGIDLALEDEDRLSAEQVAAQTSTLKAAQDALVQRVQGRGKRDVKKYSFIPFVAMHVTPSELQRLLSDAAVTSIAEDYALTPTLSDTTREIGARKLWKQGDTGEGQTIAILDSGVAKDHPVLKDKVVSEACFSTNLPGFLSLCRNGKPKDVKVDSALPCRNDLNGCDHGTRLASIAAGSKGGFKGVAPDANIIAIKVVSERTAGCFPLPTPCAVPLVSDVLLGLQQVYRLRNDFQISAVVLSLSGDSFLAGCDTTSPAMTSSIESLWRARIATIVSTGNNGANGLINFPACISSAISVGATEKDDDLWTFSNHSPLTKLLAPGVDIKSAVPAGSPCIGADGPYCVDSGTSLAVPHVAGAWALLKAAKPEATVPEILGLLSCMGRKVEARSSAGLRPRIDVFRAMTRLRFPEVAETFFFGSGDGAPGWRKNLGTWRVAGGFFQALNWANGQTHAVASLPYCHHKFVVRALMKQQPPGKSESRLHTSLFVGPHLYDDPFGLGLRATGYLFTLQGNAANEGLLSVRRLDERVLGGFGGEEFAICPIQLIPGIDVKQPHLLTIQVGLGKDGAEYVFRLDGNLFCRKLDRVHAPPAFIGLVAQRIDSEQVKFMVDGVSIEPSAP